MNKLFLFISSAIPFKVLKFLNGKKVIFPFYHLVSDFKPVHIINLYEIKTLAEFEQDLLFFEKYYDSITIDEFYNIYKNDLKPKKDSFILSFDDGLTEVYKYAFPILKIKKYKPIVFVNSAFVDNKDLFFRYKISIIIEFLKVDSIKNDYIKQFLIEKSLFTVDLKTSLLKLKHSDTVVIEQISEILEIDLKKYLSDFKPYLSTEEIKYLKSESYVIGAHSVSHPYFAQISDLEKYTQIKESIDYVTKNFDLKYRYFAFPFSDFGIKKEFFENIFKDKLVDLTFGTAGIKNDVKNNIQRIPMENGYSAKKTLKYHYFTSFLRKLIFKNYIKR